MIPEDTRRQWVIILEEAIRNAVIAGRNTDDAVAVVRKQAVADFSWNPEALDARIETLSQAEADYRAKLKRVSYLQKVAVRFGREHWYAGPAESAENWNRLRETLVSKGRAEEDIRILDEDSTSVVSLLDNPGKAKFSTRGLVVGHVQSGKTGNMAAVIAKAADTPFKFFLVLSGMTDTLRNQTQARLQRDIVETMPDRWHMWTYEDKERNGAIEKGEFAHPAVGGFAFDNRNQLAVMKKNGGVLRRFLAKLQNTDVATKQNTAFLIIDDECDQASVNSAALQRAVTKINGYIRDILGQLTRVAYVGYTATPFANVLIDPSVPEDLYPVHFIHALHRPSAYFGAERLFGRRALNGEHEDTSSGLNMIRIVPDAEVPKLRPGPGQKNAFKCQVTESLAQAILYFIMVTTARLVRGHGQEHSSMLVHTSVLNSVHRSTEAAIIPLLEDVRKQLHEKDTELLRKLGEQWEEEQEKVLAEQFDLKRVPFDVLEEHLAQVADSIEIKVENWSSTNRIDYTEPGRRYLVIGGNVLARGLTLEGLSVSFFLRSSSQYDTLMQMGRWFGYRAGFGDLPRVWMERDAQQSFFDLATVEHEIRGDIQRYADEEVTPKDVAVRIRHIPGMTITQRTKMRDAVTVEIGYAGSHQQTTRFRRKDADWLRENWNAGLALVDSGNIDVMPGRPVLRDVPFTAVLKFLETYKAHETQRPLAFKLLSEYIKKSATMDWNVAFVQGKEKAVEFGRLGPVKKVVRSAMYNSGDDASIKALMSKQDVLLDLRENVKLDTDSRWEEFKKIRSDRNMPPLLLLYPIDSVSKPLREGNVGKDGEETREPLNAVQDVLGMGIVFPGAHAAAQVYVSARLEPEEADEIPDGEDAIPLDVTDTGEK